MNIVYSPQAWADYQHWRTDRTILERINRLIIETSRDPYRGMGKPEPLKYGIPGAWSRRITDEQRLVYRVVDGELQILQARYRR